MSKSTTHILLLCASLLIPQAVLAGAWTLPRGTFWSKMTYLNITTTEEYVSVQGQNRPPDLSVTYQPGDRARYLFNGSYRSQGAIFDLFYGVVDRLDVGVQVPFYKQEFVDDILRTGFGGARTTNGLGDVRGYLKYRLFQAPAVGTFKFGVKTPTGEFLNLDGVIPVGEGQWDFDFVFQLGRSFWPLPAYANVDVGYRMRRRNDETGQDPGDEWSFLVEAGYTPVRGVLLAMKAEGIRGKTSTLFGIHLLSGAKRITYLSPTLSLGPFRNMNVEAALRISLNGRNYPAGQMLLVGVSYTGNPFRRQ